MTRLKTLSRSAVFCWSPKGVPLTLAAGTYAQQFDASFSSSACLELCPFDNDGNSAVELRPSATLPVEHRFHHLCWSADGLIIGGCDNGVLSTFDSTKLASDATSAKVSETRQHTGHVLTVDANPLQCQLVASGAAASEIYIWDLNQPSAPMSPGPKQQPFDQVMCVQWNRKVSHILGALSSSRALIWDLRKNDGPILSMGDTGTKAQWRRLCWHPEEATTLCLASEDDSNPVIQTWDVRFANSPLTNMQGHQRGVLSIGWCSEDPDLLVSCGKDNKMFLWNPNTGQFLTEIPYSARNWPFQVIWCPSNPNFIGCASFDGKIQIHSLVGGGEEVQEAPLPSPKLADSFPGADFSTQLRQARQATQQVVDTSVKLPQVPRWLRPGSCGATFAFGGRLITFGDAREFQQTANGTTAQPLQQRVVEIKQVVGNEELRSRARTLQSALDDNLIEEFCELRANDMRVNDAADQMMWTFLAAHCCQSSRKEYASILGVDFDELSTNIHERLGSKEEWKLGADIDQEQEREPTPDSDEPSDNRLAESGNSTFSADPICNHMPIALSTNPEDADGLLTTALVSGDLSAAVELCVRRKLWPEAFQLAHSISDTVFRRCQRQYAIEMDEKNSPVSRFISLISADSFGTLIDTVDLSNWRHIYALMLSYLRADKLRSYPLRLADRLMNEGDASVKKYAPLGAIIAGNIDSFVKYLLAAQTASTKTAQILNAVEKASILRWSTGSGSNRIIALNETSKKILGEYASLIADEGLLEDAWKLVQTISDDGNTNMLMSLKDRLYYSCGTTNKRQQPPPRPFNVIPVHGTPTAATAIPTVGQRPGLARTSVNQRVATSQLQPAAYQQQQNYMNPPTGGYTPQQQQMFNYSAATGDATYSQQRAYVQQQPQSMMPNYGQYGQQQTYYAQPAPPPPASAAAGVGQTITGMRAARTRISSTASDHGTSVAATPPVTGMMQPDAIEQSLIQQQSAYHAGVPSGLRSMGGGPPVAAVPPRPAGGRLSGGWNDPPPLSPKQRAEAEAAAQAAFQPLPAPFLSTVDGGSGIGTNPQSAFQRVSPNTTFAQQQQSTPHYSMPGMQQMGMPPQQLGNGPPMVAAEESSPPEEPQRPIPTQHREIADILEGLIDNCRSNPNASALSRKRLQDSKHKIEMELFMRLRNESLRENTLQNLHYLVRSLQACDYNSALGAHTQMVQGDDFAQISSFMPALKALIQTAGQLEGRK